MKGWAFLRVIAFGVAGLFLATPAFAKCEQVRVNAQTFRMLGPAGATCTLLLPLRVTGNQGQPLEFRSARTISEPGNGTVTYRPNYASRLLEVTFRSTSREPIQDRFSFELCWQGELREPCQPRTVNVIFSEEMARRAQTFCRPKPFALRTDRPVPISMSGATGDRCAIRLYRTDVAMRVSIDEPPSKGRAWVESNTIFYIGSEAGRDQFKARACRWDDVSACSILHVNVDQK